MSYSEDIEYSGYDDYDNDYDDDIDDYGYSDKMQLEKEYSNASTKDDKILACSQKHYQSITVKDLIFEIKQRITSVQQQTGASWGQSFKYLNECYFNENKAISTIQSKMDELFAEMPQELQMMQDNTECLVCFDDLNENNRVGLGCRHYACKSCYRDYVLCQIKQMGQGVIFKTCIQDGCNLLIGDVVYNVLDYHSQNIIEKFIMNNVLRAVDSYMPCPNPKCDYVLKDKRTKIDTSVQQNIICMECDYAFCSLCKSDAHQPVTCELFKQWSGLVGGETLEELNDLWLKVNTKNCPKCKINIQKNEGCMHMTCKQCGHHFCWLCMKEWSGHTDYYSCNSYKEDKSLKQEINRNQEKLKRYDFFSERYIQYKQSTEKFKKKKKDIIQRYENFFGEQGIYYNLQFLVQALDLIREGKMAITYSYINGYYIKVESEQELFKFQLGQIQDTIEKLYDQVDKDSFIHFLQEGMLGPDFHTWVTKIKELTSTLEKYINEIMREYKQKYQDLGLKKQQSYKQSQTLQLQKKQSSYKYHRQQVLCLVCDSRFSTDERGLCDTCISEQIQHMNNNNF